MKKVITIEQKDRLDLLKYVNVLREFNCNTSEKVPISYEHVCEIETLMFKLTRLLEFEQPHDVQDSKAPTSRHAMASTSTGSKSNAASTSAPRPLTGAASIRTRAPDPANSPDN